jgi:hypothetical protein
MENKKRSLDFWIGGDTHITFIGANTQWTPSLGADAEWRRSTLNDTTAVRQYAYFHSKFSAHSLWIYIFHINSFREVHQTGGTGPQFGQK